MSHWLVRRNTGFDIVVHFVEIFSSGIQIYVAFLPSLQIGVCVCANVDSLLNEFFNYFTGCMHMHSLRHGWLKMNSKLNALTFSLIKDHLSMLLLIISREKAEN